ncbi:MAG: CPBP family intramembrane glutamic endopeptidase [Anaerolineales bacterium]
MFENALDTKQIFRTITTVRFNPGRDLLAVLVSWFLVTGALYSATFLVGDAVAGGMLYFLLYAVVTATLFGVGIPLYWTVVVRKRPLSDLGITRRYLGISILIQVVLAGLQFYSALNDTVFPPMSELLPLITLALTIGFFEALFWRGWTLLRLEDTFGLIPALILGSALYALYHIGYGMSVDEMTFLFFIGLMFGVVFRLTKNIFILWPLFQPMGQLITLLDENLPLPPIAALGFFEVLIVMFVLVWLAGRYYKKHGANAQQIEK